jgi:hypothetical protein
MIASIPWLQSALNFLLNRILNLLSLFPNIWTLPPFRRIYYQSSCCDFKRKKTDNQEPETTWTWPCSYSKKRKPEGKCNKTGYQIPCQIKLHVKLVISYKRNTDLQNRIISKVVKKCLAVYWAQFHYRKSQRPPLAQILSQMNSIHTVTPCFFSIISNIITLLTLILLIGALPSDLLTKILYEFLILHMRVADTTDRTFNHSITTIFGAVKIVKILFTYFLLTFKDNFSFNHSKFDRNMNTSQISFSRVGYMSYIDLKVGRFKLLSTAVFLDMTPCSLVFFIFTTVRTPIIIIIIIIIIIMSQY